MDILNLTRKYFERSKIKFRIGFWVTSVFRHRSSGLLTKKNSLTGRKAEVQKNQFIQNQILKNSLFRYRK